MRGQHPKRKPRRKARLGDEAESVSGARIASVPDQIWAIAPTVDATSRWLAQDPYLRTGGITDRRAEVLKFVRSTVLSHTARN